NPILASGDYISEEPSWTKVWKEGISWISSIDIDTSNNINALRGIFDSNTHESYYFISKLSSLGSLEWEVPLENNEGIQTYYHTIKIDTNNNIFIAGSFENLEDQKQYMTLFKFDTNGNQVWNRSWGGYEWFEGYDMDIDSLGNIYIVGSIESKDPNNYLDMYLVKLNNSGAILWNHTWGDDNFDVYDAIAIDSYDNIYVAGIYNDRSILMKYNSSENYELILILSSSSYHHGLTIDNEENILFATNGIIIKLNSSGGPSWNYPLNLFFAPKLITDSQNNIYLAESRYIPCYDNFYFLETACICFSIYLEKINSSGDSIWEKRCTGCGDASSSDIAIDAIGNVYISGQLGTEFGCITPINDAILMKNPQAFEGLCIEIYYDLLFLIITPLALSGLIVVIILIKKRDKSKRIAGIKNS
ncbi:MAG: hypothetical protein ACFE8E_14735, partial [Candidatus Hodarchaeota archaeon]